MKLNTSSLEIVRSRLGISIPSLLCISMDGREPREKERKIRRQNDRMIRISRSTSRPAPRILTLTPWQTTRRMQEAVWGSTDNVLPACTALAVVRASGCQIPPLQQLFLPGNQFQVKNNFLICDISPFHFCPLKLVEAKSENKFIGSCRSKL